MKIRENTDTENNFLCNVTKGLSPTTQQISLINISKTVDTNHTMVTPQPTNQPNLTTRNFLKKIKTENQRK